MEDQKWAFVRHNLDNPVFVPHKAAIEKGVRERLVKLPDNMAVIFLGPTLFYESLYFDVWKEQVPEEAWSSLPSDCPMIDWVKLPYNERMKAICQATRQSLFSNQIQE